MVGTALRHNFIKASGGIIRGTLQAFTNVVSKMKFGLFISTQFNADQDLGAAMQFMAEEARIAADCGFESIWCPHHYVTDPMRMFQPHETLARLSAEVPHLRIGTGILLLSMMNPVQVAEQAATLDWMTDGGYVLAAGLGYRPEEFQSMGVERKHRLSRFIEAVEVIRRLWTEERVTHHGQHFHLDEIGLSARPRNPEGCPIWIGGAVPPAVERAATLGDAWLASFTTEPDAMRVLFDIYKKALPDGKNPEMPMCRECFLGASETDALDKCAETLIGKYAAYASWDNKHVADERPFAERFDAYRRDRFLIGDASQLTDEVARYRDELGVTTLILRMNWPGTHFADSLSSIQRFEAVIKHYT